MNFPLECVLHTLPGILPPPPPPPPSPFAITLDLLQGLTYQSKAATYLWPCTKHNYVQMHADMHTEWIHTHTETQTHAWMDAHIIIIS